MANLLERGAAWLSRQRTQHCASLVTYEDHGSRVDVRATVGRTAFEQVDEFGVVHRTESRDFLIAAEDLVLDGAVVLPRGGARIREPAGGQTFVYEVMAPGGEPPWRYSDAFRRTLRIHTKHVATETGE
ncbi:MAG: hypothetical protein PVJ57_17715 [Phycisphaerae bacterium]|jgi:hypothetical protein